MKKTYYVLLLLHLETTIWRDNLWYRHMKPKLENVKLAWAKFQVMRRTHASLGHKAGIDPKSQPISAATESGSSGCLYAHESERPGAGGRKISKTRSLKPNRRLLGRRLSS